MASEGKKKRGCLFRLFQVFVVCLLLLAVFIYGYILYPVWGIGTNATRHTRVPITPPWALECWIWEDDFNTAAATMEHIDGYLANDFPVRAVILDSPWSLRYNDFVIDEKLYPNPDQFFKTLEDRGIRVLLWMTTMVDSKSKDTAVSESEAYYQDAKNKGYLLSNGYQINWWKGKGGFIDYTNPEAMTWWRGMQEQAFKWGIDGWKLDGTATLMRTTIAGIPAAYAKSHDGWMTMRQYMDHYYRDEYKHGLTKNPEFVTLCRSIDRPFTHPEGFAPLDCAAVTWVGDNRHTWKLEEEGIEEALRDILHAAKLGYCVIGSDVGGYTGKSNPEDIGGPTSALVSSWKGDSTPAPVDNTPKPVATDSSEPAGKIVYGTAKDDVIAPSVYIRWAQMSTFCGLFMNGGHGERRLWKRTQPELEIIRKFSWLHNELVPFMYSHVVMCHNGGKPLMRPQATGSFHYLFGDDFLVAPIHEDKLARQVSLPAGSWRYFFNDKEVLQGPQTLTREFPLDEFPVFVRDGAVVPTNVTRPYTGLGDRDSEGFTTWLIYPSGKSKFTQFHPDGMETTVNVAATDKNLDIKVEGRKQPHILRILSPKKPADVSLDGLTLAEGAGWRYDEKDQRLCIKTSTYNEGAYSIRY